MVAKKKKDDATAAETAKEAAKKRQEAEKKKSSNLTGSDVVCFAHSRRRELRYTQYPLLGMAYRG